MDLNGFIASAAQGEAISGLNAAGPGSAATA